jgi:hypothetical protein
MLKVLETVTIFIFAIAFLVVLTINAYVIYNQEPAKIFLRQAESFPGLALESELEQQVLKTSYLQQRVRILERRVAKLQDKQPLDMRWEGPAPETPMWTVREVVTNDHVVTGFDPERESAVMQNWSITGNCLIEVPETVWVDIRNVFLDKDVRISVGGYQIPSSGTEPCVLQAGSQEKIYVSE